MSRAPQLITDGNHRFAPWISAAQIQERTRDMAADMAQHFRGERVRLLAVLQGARPFHQLLAQELGAQPDGPAEIQTDAMWVKSYAGDQSTGMLKWLQYPTLPQDNNVHTVIVEDILDTGNTLSQVTRHLGTLGAASLSTAVLLDKAPARTTPFEADWAGFTIPDAFVIGFGLDLDERHRQHPDIYAALAEHDHELPDYSLPQFRAAAH
ncbi:MAG TPA: phosphoribosyltransferase family protein [Candidatus Saccharimonadales bacterium]|nr:phosphoribosyltransferase family protein [Candidatus Saccharimonadales bacterium]